MTPRDLIAAFDVVSDAPDGIKRLRELVLQLAVRGKLVPQDPRDVPVTAEELIQGRRALLASASFTEPRHPTSVLVDEPPHAIPHSWRWYRLGDVGAVVGGGTPASAEQRFWADGAGIPWLTPADMRGQPSRYIIRGSRDITQAGLECSSAQLLPKGTVLFSSRAPIGHVGIAADALSTNQGFKSCVPVIPEMSEYIYVFLRKAGPEINAAATGTTFKEVSGKDVALVPIPVPPLPEQGRIVARVDELMSLLDRLQAAHDARASVRATTRDASLAALRDATESDEVETAWRRVADRLDDLCVGPGDVKPLRETVLELAVRGRLVRQFPLDDDARVVLRRVRDEQAALVERGILRRPPAAPPVKDEDVPFPVPRTWEWSRLGAVTLSVTDGDHLPPPRAPEGVAFLTIGNVSSGWLDFTETRFVPRAYFDGLDTFRRPQRGDLLYTVVGATYGRPVRVDDAPPFCVQRHIAIIRPSSLVMRDYLDVFLRSPTAYAQATATKTGSAQPTVALGPLRNFVVPVPPLQEQQRIVAKVDELMGMLDRLEMKLREAQETQAAFAAAAVHHLDADGDNAEPSALDIPARQRVGT